MTDPRILSIISFVFALMAAYSLYTGMRQWRDARRAGQQARWYKQLSLLTGIEYTLLTFVFLLRTATLQNTLAPSIKSIVGVIYILLLIPAAIIAGLVIRRVLLNMRANGQANRARAQASVGRIQAQTQPEEAMLSKQEKEKQSQRQRERRKKAAAARRRQAGKA